MEVFGDRLPASRNGEGDQYQIVLARAVHHEAEFHRKHQMTRTKLKSPVSVFLCTTILFALPLHANAQRTQKPVLHGKHWIAITGKPLAATARAMIFQEGGNAVDAACAMALPPQRCGTHSPGVARRKH